MKIAIIGAGAMGSLFGGRLTAGGHEVCLVDVDPDHIAAIQKNGLFIQNGDTVEHTLPRAGQAHEFNEPQDFLIIFTKSVHTGAALNSVRHLVSDQTWILTAQNGLGHVEKIAPYIATERIAIGTTSYAAGISGPGRVTLHPSGSIRIWSAKGNPAEPVERLAAAMAASGIDCTADPEVEIAIWEKVAFNAAINSLSTVSRYPVGGLGDFPAGRTLARLIIGEVDDVAKARGVAMVRSRVEALVDHAFAHHRDHQPSMLRDFLAKRPTEIESINGAIVDEARKLGVQTPVTETLLLLVRLVEGSTQQ